MLSARNGRRKCTKTKVLLAFLAVNSILLITLSASFLSKNPETAMCISLGVLFLLRPDVLNIFTPDKQIISKIVSLTPYNIINTSDLVQQMPVCIGGSTVQWIYIVEVVYVLLLAAFIIMETISIVWVGNTGKKLGMSHRRQVTILILAGTIFSGTWQD